VPLTIWLLARLWPSYRPNLRHFGATALRLVRYGFRCYPVELINAASTYIGQSIVVASVAPTGVGWFTVSLSIARLLEIFHAAVSTVLLPATAARPPGEVIDVTIRAARLTGLMMALFAAPLLLLLPWLLPFVYGQSFADAVPIARLLLVEGLISGTIWVLLQGFLALGRPGLATILQTAGICGSVTLLLLIVPEEGALGAAKVLLAVAIIKLALIVALYRFALGTPLRLFLYRKADLAYARDLLRR
jgi:enterobacterial common antigen flippase